MEHKSENVNCQNCHKDFTIEPEDFLFYKKIKVPPPTFCPDCRTTRRLCWRNEMCLHKRKCDAPGHDEQIISIYHPDEKLVVYDFKTWWGDQWDPIFYGRDYDFTVSFFEQWKNLRNQIPLQSLSNSSAINSDYCNVADNSKDSYMASGSEWIEKTFYSNRISQTKECSDLYISHRSELCYEDVFCTDSYHLLYSENCKNCVDSYFLFDCHGCINCLGCSSLRSKSYCMWNEQLTKEEYFDRLKNINLKDHKTISELKEKFEKLKSDSIHRFANLIKTINSTGDNLDGAKNSRICFDTAGNVEDCKYVHWSLKIKDAYDSGPGIGLAELIYEAFDTGMGNYRNLFTSVVYSTNNAEYCFNCYGCSNLFGCIGLRNKNYCILNKQYDKKEYEKMVLKIKEQMDSLPYIDSRGRVYKYGEFFPAELSPFCYNETQAQDYFPLTKEQALKMGYRWRDKEINKYKIEIEAENLPDDLANTPDSIVGKVIGCAHKGACQDNCSGAFKIIENEFNLYKKIGVPLPHLCFNCRHANRLRKRKPMKLWHRTCICNKDGHQLNSNPHASGEKCKAEFETSYAPDRPETIYCESCYNKEVY